MNEHVDKHIKARSGDCIVIWGLYINIKLCSKHNILTAHITSQWSNANYSQECENDKSLNQRRGPNIWSILIKVGNARGATRLTSINFKNHLWIEGGHHLSRNRRVRKSNRRSPVTNQNRIGLSADATTTAQNSNNTILYAQGAKRPNAT